LLISSLRLHRAFGGLGVFLQILLYQLYISGMDDLFLNRMLFEWLRDC
jgi:hypothetical protein